jgi:O-antigen ligase
MSFEQYPIGADVQTSAIPSMAENALWVLFLFAAIGGFNVVLSDQMEKAAWLAADVAACAAALGSSAFYATKATQLWPLFSWPFLAVTSALWSLTPGLTVYHGVQLFMTILVGAVMQNRLGTQRFIILLFVSLAIGVLTSLTVVAAGQGYAISPRGEWKGIFSHKNVLGFASVLLIYTGLALVRKYWLVLPIVALATLTLIGSRSATSLLVCGAVVGVIPLGLILPLRFYAFGAAGSFLLAAAVLAAGFMLIDDTSIVASLLGALRRDDTLTGRADLWSFGWEAFTAHPVLGLGYKAYWASDATSAAYLRYFVQQELWFFHNNWLEVAVGTGLVGLALFGAGLVQAIVRVIIANRRTPGISSAWSLMFLVHVLILTTVENPLFYNHSLAQILLVVVAAGAIGRESDRRVDRRLPIGAEILDVAPTRLEAGRSRT